MIVTGTNSYIYEIYHQSGMSARFETDNMKDVRIRVLTNSGGNYYQDFLFTSGKAFIGNSLTTGGYNFVGGYASGAPMSFDFRYNSGRYSFYLNDSVKIAGKQILNSQTFQPLTEMPTITGFMFSGIGSGGLTGNMEILGTKPGVYFSDLYQYNYPAQTGLYSGWVIISGFPAKLYSINLDNGYQYQIPSSAFTSGNYIISGVNFGSGATTNSDFGFNFGTVNTDLRFNVPSTGSPTGFLSVSQANSSIVYSGLPNPIQYIDYSALNFIPNTGNFRSYLEFLYRSGDMIITGTGNITGNMTGYISGSGYLYGSGTGYTYNGTYSQRGQTVSLTPFIRSYTGTMTPRFVYGTGYVYYDYSILATGVELLDGTFLPDNTTGRLTGRLTGYINDGSGYYTFNQIITGRPQFWSGGYQTGNQAAGEYYKDLHPSSVSEYHSFLSGVNYTGSVNAIVYWTGNMNQQYVQGFTGTFLSGVYDTNSGYISGFNLLTGDPYLSTGNFQFVYNNYYNYTGNGNVSGRYLIKPATSVTNGIYEYGMRITHDRNLPNGVYDFYKFYVEDGALSYSTTGRMDYL